MSTCGECKGFTREQIYIGYYLCRTNSDEGTQYLVKEKAHGCENHKQKKQTKQEKKDE